MMKPVVLVTYRDRPEHLRRFVPKLNAFLPGCEIVVIEQLGTEPFNRGKLFNIGYLESKQPDSYYILHDVDMLPITADYSFSYQPCHIATQCSQFNYRMPYKGYFGGVNIFSSKVYEDINGFPNNLRGWGGEDDLLRESCIKKGYQIIHRECRFRSLQHERVIDMIDHAHNVEIVNAGRDFDDGLTSCQYEVKERVQKDGYMLLKVDIQNISTDELMSKNSISCNTQY